MSIVKQRACRQENCPVKEKGECLEALEDLEECTHFYWNESDDGGEIDEGHSDTEMATSSGNTSRFTLFSANELTLQEIPIVTNKHHCELVVILGDLDSGKTTLLATIFDLFQTGDFQNLLFAGSLTQKGFERRSHLSRVVSGRSKADTERTKSLEFRVLHLAVKVKGRSEVRHLLLSDVSGETIRQARNSSSVMKKQLQVVKHADHLFYVLDGEGLTSQNRAKTLLNADLFIKSAIQNQIFNSSTKLNILITKWDKLKGERNFDGGKFLEELKQRFEDKFGPDLGMIVFSKIASRPDEHVKEFDMGYGVSEFLNDLLLERRKQIPSSIPVNTSERFIDRFKVKGND